MRIAHECLTLNAGSEKGITTGEKKIINSHNFSVRIMHLNYFISRLFLIFLTAFARVFLMSLLFALRMLMRSLLSSSKLSK
jgi:cytochrome b subunit of formate dehydrogenase